MINFAPLLRMVLTQLVISGLGFFILWFLSMNNAGLSFLAGGILFAMLVSISWFAWKGVIQKKKVALAVGLIVIKYAILIFFVYFFVKSSWISLGWFIAGIASFKIPIGVEMIANSHASKQEDAENERSQQI